MDRVRVLTQDLMKKDIVAFDAGDTIKVHTLIKEGDKQRVQIFQGVCIAKKNAGISSTFTVRKISSGVGVERIFPYHSPLVSQIELVNKGKVRRSKIYYLRDLFGKAARIKRDDK